MSDIKVNGVSFSTKFVSKFKSAEQLAASLPHIWPTLANRGELFTKVYDLVKPPKTEKKKDTAKEK
jgi:hypothetical protein